MISQPKALIMAATASRVHLSALWHLPGGQWHRASQDIRNEGCFVSPHSSVIKLPAEVAGGGDVHDKKRCRVRWSIRV